REEAARRRPSHRARGEGQGRLRDPARGALSAPFASYRLPRFISPSRWSVERTVRAMIVSVGFWQALEVKPEPSITNRFLTSCVCWKALSTDFFGSAPIDRKG